MDKDPLSMLVGAISGGDSTDEVSEEYTKQRQKELSENLAYFKRLESQVNEGRASRSLSREQLVEKLKKSSYYLSNKETIDAALSEQHEIKEPGRTEEEEKELLLRLAASMKAFVPPAMSIDKIKEVLRAKAEFDQDQLKKTENGQ